MSEWKEIPLIDVIDLVGGGTPKTSVPDYWNGEIPWLSVADFNNGRKYVTETEKCITNLGLKNSSTKILQKGDIIISARGTVGVVSMLGREMAFNQSCYGIRAKTGLSINDFIYYFLKHAVNNFQQISHGGVFDTITRDTFREIDILLPSLPEQKAIASVLSSLDDKIDLLHRQNKNLEAMAETLFRQWFVEKVDEEWEEKSLLEITQLIGGGTPKTTIEEYWGGDIPWLTGGDIASNHKSFVIHSAKSITQDGLLNSSTKLLPKNSTVISARGTVGKYCLLAQSMAFSQSNYGILPKISKCFFFTYLLVNHVVEELQTSAYGSVFDTITTATFKGIKTYLPTEETIIQFEKMVSPYFTKMLLNQSQIINIENLRDILLTKLMSCEVRVRHKEYE